MPRETFASLFVCACGALGAACDDSGPRDTVADLATDPAIWQADGRALLAALPRQVGAYRPSEGADAFATTFHTGPVFGANGTYADGARNLVVRVEGGNIRERAATLVKGHANPGEAFVTKEVTIHGVRGTLHWNQVGLTGDVVYVLDRRILVELRVMPAKSENEVVELANAMEVAPLLAAPLKGLVAP